jgi:transposase
MMGRQVGEAQLFYTFSVDRHVPADHLLRRVDAVLDLSFIRTSLADYYSRTGRSSIDPELMIRMLLVGYLYGIRSETRICEEVHLNLAYRWFCRLGLDADVPERSTFSKNRHGRFREGDLFRRLFEEVVRRCVAAGLVGGTGAGWTEASSRPMPVASAACPAIACPRHGLIGRARHSPSART